VSRQDRTLQRETQLQTVSSPAFYSALRADSVVIYTSAALAVVPSERQTVWQPRNLNIVVPAGQGHHLTELLSTRSFCQKAVTDGGRGSRPWSRVWNIGLGTAQIIVVESRDSTVLPVILCAQSTTQMVAISQRCIYCFHASLTLASTTVLGSSSKFKRQARLHVAKGVIMMDTRKWSAPCDWACLALVRRVHGRRDMGVV
jgi:hypothetical protein